MDALREKSRQDEILIAELRSSAVHTERRERELQAEADARESRIAALDGAIQAARGRVQELEIHLSEQSASLAAIRERNAEDQRNLQRQNEEIEGLVSQLETQKELRYQESLRTSQLEEALAQASQRVEALQKELDRRSDVHLEHEVLKSSFAELRSRFEEERMRAEELRRLREREGEAREALQIEIKEREARISVLTREMEAARQK